VKNACGLFALGLAASGCLKVPEIVVTDRVTALEEQAGGSFEELELKLTRAGIGTRPLALTPQQLETLGLRRPEELKNPDLTKLDRLDRLLRRHCVGEGFDGLLVETAEACRGAVDHDELEQLIERTNLARGQLWQWLWSERPKRSLDEVKRAWVITHRQGVVCGAWVQKPDGSWEERGC
jgi:hypothetical protein